MKSKKMSLANLQGKLSRAEMKSIKGGLIAPGGGTCKICTENWCKGQCYCSSAMGQCSGTTCTGSC